MPHIWSKTIPRPIIITLVYYVCVCAGTDLRPLMSNHTNKQELQPFQASINALTDTYAKTNTSNGDAITNTSGMI